jgi:hypothetical protein
LITQKRVETPFSGLGTAKSSSQLGCIAQIRAEGQQRKKELGRIPQEGLHREEGFSIRHRA